MFIQNRQTALDVLSKILDLPTRTEQLVALTIKIVLCMDPDPRMFLADCQAALIEGGLEEMKKRRQEARKAKIEETQLIVVLDPVEDALFEEVASTRDALRIVKVVTEVFPELAMEADRYVIARAVLQREEEVKECIFRAVRSRGKGDAAERNTGALQKMRDLATVSKPNWDSRAPAIREACLQVITEAKLAPEDQIPNRTEYLFTTIAARDERALEFLKWLEEDPAEAVAFVGKLSELLDSLLEMPVDSHTGVTDVHKATA